MFQVSLFYCKFYIRVTEVICVYGLNARDFFNGDAKFSREFCMGCGIPCSVVDSKNTERVPKSLGDLTQVPDPL